MRTIYFADGCHFPFLDKEEALKEEARQKEIMQRVSDSCNEPKAKFDKLKMDLENAMIIAPGTIATCSFLSLQIKGLVQVCKNFYEENKEFLKYY